MAWQRILASSATRLSPRVVRATPRFLQHQHQHQYQHRLASNSATPSAHTQFYKTFGRPVFKVVLMALLTYQVVYLGWMKLEQDEAKAEKEAEVAALETQVNALSASKGP